jgi:predicted ATPase
MQPRAGEVFVGRTAELEQLGRALDAAAAGRGATVLVAGEVGIGKTRLVAELDRRARGAGFEVLLGRCIDLVDTQLPYQPFVEALRALDGFSPVAAGNAGSPLQVFEETLALLRDRAAAAPVLLVLEDLHWADTATLDLVVYLAHALADLPVVLLVTFRADEPASAGRMGRLVDGVRRSGSALSLVLGPFPPGELTALLSARHRGPVPAPLASTITARSEGNPLFAEELLAAADSSSGVLPQRLSDVLLRRVARMDRRTVGLLRIAAAAGRDVGEPLLREVSGLPQWGVRESLRVAVGHGVLVVEQATGRFRFRHALLAEAV